MEQKHTAQLIPGMGRGELTGESVLRDWNWKRGVPQIAVGICNFSFTQHQRMIGVD